MTCSPACAKVRKNRLDQARRWHNLAAIVTDPNAIRSPSAPSPVDDLAPLTDKDAERSDVTARLNRAGFRVWRPDVHFRASVEEAESIRRKIMRLLEPALAREARERRAAKRAALDAAYTLEERRQIISRAVAHRRARASRQSGDEGL